MQKKYNWELQCHPYAPFIAENAKALILGSAPPWRFCVREPKPLNPLDIDYYYGSHNRGYNLLWELLFRVFESSALRELDKIRKLQFPRPERTRQQTRFFQEFLSRHCLGMADILHKFHRRDRSAADSRIKALEFNNILVILELHPDISNIFCTSRHNVFLWLEQYLANNRVKLISEEGLPWFFKFPGHPGHRVNVYVLPSPSPIGRIRFPNHHAFVHHLTDAYESLFGNL